VAVIVGSEAILLGAIVIGNRSQGAEQNLPFSAGAFALDKKDEAVEFILDILGLR
jgi:hypothetical protein